MFTDFISTTQPFNLGCERAFGAFVKEHAVDIGAVGFVLAFIQVRIQNQFNSDIC